MFFDSLRVYRERQGDYWMGASDGLDQVFEISASLATAVVGYWIG